MRTALVKFIVENEEATASATLPLLNRSNFPRSKVVIAQLNAGAAGGACGLDAEHSISLLNKLIKRNQQSVKWHPRFAELPVRYVTDPMKVDDFLRSRCR